MVLVRLDRGTPESSSWTSSVEAVRLSLVQRRCCDLVTRLVGGRGGLPSEDFIVDSWNNDNDVLEQYKSLQ